MEKQKIFWVILSVSIFIVVILVAGVFLLKQKPLSVSSETISPLSEPGTHVYEFGQEKPQPAQPEVTPNEPEVLKLVIGEEPGKKTEPQKLPTPTPPVAPPEKPAQPLVPEQPKPALQQKPQAEQPRIAEAPRKPQAQKPAGSRSAPRKPEAQKPSPQKPVPARTVRGVDYWIQTGSYRSQTKAEDLARLLGDKGISARVFSYTVSGGDMYFRVRIGPYGNKNEAGKFLAIVKQIEGLESSYISSVAGTRTIN